MLHKIPDIIDLLYENTMKRQSNSSIHSSAQYVTTVISKNQCDVTCRVSNDGQHTHISGFIVIANSYSFAKKTKVLALSRYTDLTSANLLTLEYAGLHMVILRRLLKPR